MNFLNYMKYNKWQLLMKKVITLYPQTPKIEKGNRTSLLNDHKLEIDVQGKPHKIFPFNQSNKEK